MADSDATIKLTFKDLKQQKFQIDAKPSNTIAEIKEMIEKEKGWEVTTQKLIYSGKILQDKNTVESYNIEEKGFVVCMVSKPKVAPGVSTPGSSSSAAAAAPSTPVKSPSTPAQVPAAPAQVPAAPQASTSSTTAATVPETPTPAAQTETSGASTFNDPSALAMGAGRDAVIAQMTEMGFERSQVERAMRAAYNNPDRAVEYLMTGIPEHLQRETAPAQSRPAAPRPQAQPASGNAPASTGAAASAEDPSSENVNLFEAAAARAAGTGRGGGGGAAAAGGASAEAVANLDFLRNNPQFQQLRQVIQQQPQMLEPILQQVGSGNPQLAQLINSNPEAFLNLLAEGEAGEEGEDDGMGGTVPPGATAIPVTEAERDAIERLCLLGFDRELVIQAYFACDKNEELAANFLFEQPPDEDGN